MLNKSEVAYPRLTRLFYINLKLKKGKEWCLTSKVAGKDIELNHKVFSEVLGFDFKIDADQILDKKQLIQSAKLDFFNESSPPKHQHTHSILEAEAKILFTIFTRWIVPKENSKELLSDKVLLWMHMVMYNFQLDLPTIVMEHMLYASTI